MPSTNDFALLYFVGGPLWCVFCKWFLIIKNQEFTSPFNTNLPAIYPSTGHHEVTKSPTKDSPQVKHNFNSKQPQLVSSPTTIPLLVCHGLPHATQIQARWNGVALSKQKDDTGWVTGTQQVLKCKKLVPLPVRWGSRKSTAIPLPL